MDSEHRRWNPRGPGAWRRAERTPRERRRRGGGDCTSVRLTRSGTGVRLRCARRFPPPNGCFFRRGARHGPRIYGSFGETACTEFPFAVDTLPVCGNFDDCASSSGIAFFELCSFSKPQWTWHCALPRRAEGWSGSRGNPQTGLRLCI